MNTKRLVLRMTLIAMASALYFVFGHFLKIKLTDNVQLTVKGLPVLIIAIAVGPVDAMSTAIIGEFFCQLTSEWGLSPTTVLWILAPALRGLIVGLLFEKQNPNEHKLKWVLTVLVSNFAVTVVNLGITFLDAYIWDYSAGLLMIDYILKIVTSVGTAIVFIFVTPLITKAINIGYKKE